jgi:hypothetical protein
MYKSVLINFKALFILYINNKNIYEYFYKHFLMILLSI